MDLLSYFTRVFVVNLNRREDRLNKFLAQIPDDWPFAEPQKVSAIDGKHVKPPDWWRQGPAAWGCYRSHLRLIENALNFGHKSILLLEDDALFCKNFGSKVRTFLEHVPKDWDMIYLGGQHLGVQQHPPKRVNDWVYQPWNVNRTHAFAIRGRMLQILYKHLQRQDWQKGHHIDHHLGRIHMQRQHKIYCPKEWLVGQAEGRSNISGKTPGNRFWAPAEVLNVKASPDQIFVAVLGLHGSGSSCLAGVMHKLGLHLGNNLHGNHTAHGYEPEGLARICEAVVPFPTTRFALEKEKAYWMLKRWIDQRKKEAKVGGTVACGKYPQLCAFHNQLLNICGSGLRVIESSRPLEDSVQSIIRRVIGRKSPDATRFTTEMLRDHQLWLARCKEELRDQLPSKFWLQVNYYDLLDNPEKEIDRILDFLNFSATPAQITDAVSWVRKDKVHIRSSSKRSKGTTSRRATKVPKSKSARTRKVPRSRTRKVSKLEDTE